jgi:hypothetical protein
LKNTKHNLETRGINKFLKAQDINAKAILLAIAGVFMVFQARGQSGYLEIVGPPAMRFEVENTNRFLLAAKFPMLQPKPDPMVVSNAVTSNVSVTNEVMKILEPEATSNIQAGHATGLPNQATVFSVAGGADNSIDTTPQMIMPYLEPDLNGGQMNLTNHPATAVFVPTWMGFVPTLMQFPIENKTESRATYISQ